MNSIRKILLTAVFGLTLGAVSAQSPEDSVAFADSRWNEVFREEGITVRTCAVRLFNSDQQIVCMEINPQLYRFAVVQDSLREKVSKLAKKYKADAAINGGFFKVRTPLAIAVGYIQIDCDSVPQLTGNYNGAVAIDTTGRISVIPWNKKMKTDPAYVDLFPDILTAGPLLIDQGHVLQKWDETEPRHPRSCIGTRPDGSIMLLVVDGRQKDADGMALCELARVARWMGMTQALNLDGGGSSALWSRQKGVVNSPCDRGLFSRKERKVCNAITVTKKE